jgi:hypothetical protein
VQQHIEWNPATQLWETEQADLFSGQQEPFSETWPTSGMTRNGQLLPLPTSAPPTVGSECSSLPTGAEMFHTPDTMPDAPNKGSNTKSKPAGLGNQVMSLLPTPVAMDSVGARNATSSRQPGSKHHAGTTLTDVLWQMAGITDAPTPLLPSPVARQSGSTPEEHLARKPGRTQVTDLAIIVENGLM